jgi:RimJ/RimL family protein N-acetyltransferase
VAFSKYSIITNNPDFVGEFVMSRQPHPAAYVPGSCQALGWAHGNHLIAGVLYYQYSSVNIWAAVAAEPGHNWLNRAGLWAIFDYPFRQLKVRRMTIAIDEGNAQSIRFCERLGFQPETRLAAASPSGDLLIYRMFEEDCLWLSDRRYRVQRRQGSQGPGLRSAGEPARPAEH